MSFLKPYFCEGGIWTLAIRPRGKETLTEGNTGVFSVIPNSYRYWRADPFLFDRDGKTYLFAELFDRIKGKGILGVAEIKNGKCGKFRKCLELETHLSYPCVYEYNGQMFMVPENCRSNGIAVYKCVDFPLVWEKDFDLLDKPGVDTTPVADDKLRFYSTLHLENGNNDNLYLLEKGKEPVKLLDGDFCVRSAGHIIKKDGRIIRVTQDCMDSYGARILFREVKKNGTEYSEKELLSVYPPDTECKNGDISVIVSDRKKYTGLHTYNLSKDYEIIDLSYDVNISFVYFIRKIRKHFIRRKK